VPSRAGGRVGFQHRAGGEALILFVGDRSEPELLPGSPMERGALVVRARLAAARLGSRGKVRRIDRERAQLQLDECRVRMRRLGYTLERFQAVVDSRPTPHAPRVAVDFSRAGDVRDFRSSTGGRAIDFRGGRRDRTSHENRVDADDPGRPFHPQP
jgi:hypothetical protein